MAKTEDLLARRKAAFLDEFRKHGLISRAANAVLVTRNEVVAWRENDPAFRQGMIDATLDAGDVLEAAAFHRGVEGYEEPLVHQGHFTYLYEDVLNPDGTVACDENGNQLRRPVLDENGHRVIATVRKYSDALLMRMLEANVKKYAKLSKVELTGADGGPLQTEENPLAAARKIAFALAMGLRAKQEAHETGEDMV